MTTNPRHDPCPMPGYREGLILSDTRPVQERTPNPDGKVSPLHDVINDWFYIDNSRYNVHPFRSDFGGYPIRWIETIDFDALTLSSTAAAVETQHAIDTGADINDGLTDDER